MGLGIYIHFPAFSPHIRPFLPKSLNYCIQIVLLYKKYNESALLQPGAATWPHIAEDKMKIDYSHMIFQERDRQAGDTV
jgi:hypothetical protein